MIYSLCFVLIAIGLYGVVVKKNIVKIVISLAIMEYGVNLFLILLGYRFKGEPPIMDQAADASLFVANAVDPLPQALVLTSIVISLGVLALMVALCIRLYERYGTFDITEMRRLKG
ncbi:MAG: sodium:proton antiporter [Verrucomicrobia bacterium]|nr:sodium:proton antiporter [Verrucomicrobiota bacterium]MBU1908783.1 sodium:proton antiporter [Verrucomicrobiota bacterium]